MLVDFVQLSCSACSRTRVCCLLRCGPVGVICNMTEICFVWRENSTRACLLKTNSSIGRQLFYEQTDLDTIRSFSLHDITFTLYILKLMKVQFHIIYQNNDA